MPPTDVVEHDLTASLKASIMDWTEDVEPVPMPVARRALGEEVSRLTGKPPVTTRVSATELITAPYRSVGKLQVIRGGGTKGSSGWVVAPRAFITAGHCVYNEERGGWITRAAFCPRFDNACEKAYEVTTVYALKGWIDSGTAQDKRYDMAACVVSENFADTEPPLSFDTGLIPGLKFAAIGYPIKPLGEYDFNGKRMWKSVGALVLLKDDLTWAENNLTGGASGGPWCDPTDNFTVSGLTSHRDDDPNVAASPSFESAFGFQNLYDAVKNS